MTDTGVHPSVDTSACLLVAEQIGHTIVEDAVWAGDRCNWVGAMPEESADRGIVMTYRALGPDLYGGSAGVGLFLAELASVPSRADVRATALGALRHAASRVDSIPASARNGLYGGRFGVALALARAAQLLEEPELAAAACAIVRDASRDRDVAAESDLVSGRAGAIVGLLALRNALDESDLVEAALAHGEALLESADESDGALSWPSPSLPGTPGLAGFSHGAGGIGTAFLELWKATNEDRFRAAAEAAFAYERALFDEGARNWPDLRGNPQGDASTFVTFWCHGAPGIALSRIRAIELGANGHVQSEAETALETTTSWVGAALASGSNYSLCHGLAGNAEILFEGASLIGDDTGELTARVAGEGIDTYHARRLPWPSGAYGGHTPSLFLGAAGIGRFYLRLAVPELPSLLLVRPEAFSRL